MRFRLCNPTLLVKAAASRVPLPIGAALARIPFGLRPGIGPGYFRRQREIATFNDLSPGHRQRWLFERVRAITVFAAENVPFYRRYYARVGFSPTQLRHFEDLRLIPIVTSAMLRSVEVADRSCSRRGAFLANTGGSTGQPLCFYLEAASFAQEWAHMHSAWSHVGFKPSHLRLTLVGRSTVNGCIEYDGARHQYAVNIYRPLAETAAALRALGCHRFSYIAGYPSALHEFALFCDAEARDLRDELRAGVRAALLGSEFPAPEYRSSIERVFETRTLAFYGHSERAAFASEWDKRDVYHVYQTYGYAEAVPDSDRGNQRLVATSMYNYASPFIRYDTGDLIEPLEVRDGILSSMLIKEGRVGECIRDRNLQAIPVTGLIFGRHHSVFSAAQHVQIAQQRPGEATVYVVPRAGLQITESWVGEHFDGGGVALTFTYRVIEHPFRTPSGKVPVLIPAAHSAN